MKKDSLICGHVACSAVPTTQRVCLGSIAFPTAAALQSEKMHGRLREEAGGVREQGSENVGERRDYSDSGMEGRRNVSSARS